MLAPYLLTCPLRSPIDGPAVLPQIRSLGDLCNSLTVGPIEAAGSGRGLTHRSSAARFAEHQLYYRNVSVLFRIKAAITAVCVGDRCRAITRLSKRPAESLPRSAR